MKKELQDKLADYKNKLDDAWDLLREATDKIREANHLSVLNQKNMTVLEVSVRSPFIAALGIGSELRIARTVKWMHIYKDHE
jgi:DNA-binding IclR family transcriptional regulator